MIVASVWVLSALAITSLAAPAPAYEDYYEVQVPQKRAALVLDRLLVALQHALHEGEGGKGRARQEDGPRAAPLRGDTVYSNDMSPLQRRGLDSPGRGMVLPCYFNVITCF